MAAYRYYLISYLCQKLRNEKQFFENELTTLHPLQWIIDTREQADERYTLISYQQITKEEYEKYSEAINLGRLSI